MSLTHVEIEIANVASPEKTERVRCLVDSGAIYSVIPSRVLTRLGIQVIAEDSFFLANGEKITRKRGVALYRFGERVGGADAVFGEEGDQNPLCALTLEALGLGLNPLRRELYELPMSLARMTK